MKENLSQYNVSYFSLTSKELILKVALKRHPTFPEQQKRITRNTGKATVRM